MLHKSCDEHVSTYELYVPKFSETKFYWVGVCAALPLKPQLQLGDPVCLPVWRQSQIEQLWIHIPTICSFHLQKQ